MNRVIRIVGEDKEKFEFDDIEQLIEQMQKLGYKCMFKCVDSSNHWKIQFEKTIKEVKHK